MNAAFPLARSVVRRPNTALKNASDFSKSGVNTSKWPIRAGRGSRSSSRQRATSTRSSAFRPASTLFSFALVRGNSGIEINPSSPRILKPKAGTLRAIGCRVGLHPRFSQFLLKGVFIARANCKRNVMHSLLSRAGKYDDVVSTSCRPRRTTEAKRGATPLRRQPECPVEPLGNRHVGYLQADPSQTNNFGFVHFLAPRMIF